MAEKKRRTRGSGRVYQEPGRSWAVQWRENGQRRYKGAFTSKALAEAFMAAVRVDAAREVAGLPPDKRGLPLLRDLAAEWIARRQFTHRSWADDRGRWNHHLAPHFGKLRAPDVDTASIRAFVEAKIQEAEIEKTTIGLCVRCLSTFFSDLCERPRETGAARNPVAGLPKSLRRLYKSEHDSRFTPYLRRLGDVAALYGELPEPISIAYAVGVCAGLRTGEVLALDWNEVDEAEPRIDVRWQALNGKRGPLKDDEARILQGEYLAPLVPILRAWRLRTGGRGLLFPPELTRTPGRRMGKYMTPHRLYGQLVPALERLHLPALSPKPWYQATRHTFASHWVRAGHPIAGLAHVLGHSTTWVTERYAHQEGGATEDPWRLSLTRDATVIALSPRARE